MAPVAPIGRIRRSVTTFEDLTVDLNARNAKAGRADGVDCALPETEFFVAKPIAGAGVDAAEDAFADRADNVGLAARDPSFGVGRRKAIERRGGQTVVKRITLVHGKPPFKLRTLTTAPYIGAMHSYPINIDYARSLAK
jgi:hypothetical protein